MKMSILSSIVGVAALSLLKFRSGSGYKVEFDDLFTLLNSNPNAAFKVLQGVKGMRISFNPIRDGDINQEKQIYKQKIRRLNQMISKERNRYKYAYALRGMNKLEINIGSYAWQRPNLILDQETFDLIFDFLSNFGYQELSISVDQSGYKIPTRFNLSMTCKKLYTEGVDAQNMKILTSSIPYGSHIQELHIRSDASESGKYEFYDLSSCERLSTLVVYGCLGFPDISNSINTITRISIERSAKTFALPKYLNKCKNLSTLIVQASSGSNIRIIPEFTKCKKLEVIRISSPRRTKGYAQEKKSLPKNLFYNCPNLKELSLRYMGISEIPVQIGESKNLEIINLQGSNLRTIPASIFDIPTLKEIDIRSNPLRELPKEFWIAFLTETKIRFRLLHNNSRIPTLIVPPMEALVRMLEGKRMRRSGEARIMKVKSIHPQERTNIRRF